MERIIVTMDGKRVLSVDNTITNERLLEIIKNFLIEKWVKIEIKRVKIAEKKHKKEAKKV